jgi:hypothetical protein
MIHTHSQWWSVCIKNYITCTKLWVDEVYEMIAVEVKGTGPKITLEIVDIYTVKNNDMRFLEKLAYWT